MTKSAEIERFAIWAEFEDSDPEGEWVRYEDHVKVMAALQARVKKEREDYEALASKYEKLLGHLPTCRAARSGAMDNEFFSIYVFNNEEGGNEK